MEDLLKSTLGALGYPVRIQGSLLPDESYPESFFTYWNDSADGSGFYNNAEDAIVWAYSLNFYSTDFGLINSVLLEAKKLLRAKGFTVSGAGYDVLSDEPEYAGRGITVLYRQKQ